MDKNSALLDGIGESIRAWMSHGDEAEEIPTNFEVIGHTENSHAAAIANTDRTVFGIQFQPEVVHTERGTDILKNFVLNVCKAKQEWTMEGFVDKTVKEISEIDGNVLCGVSGGIDSTVAALLFHKAVGCRLTGVFVDNGLLRLNESEEIEDMFKNNFELNFHRIDASEQFLSKLKGVTDPEQKRKIVGEEFIQVFTDFAKQKGPFKWLAQGTLYPCLLSTSPSPRDS